MNFAPPWRITLPNRSRYPLCNRLNCPKIATTPVIRQTGLVWKPFFLAPGWANTSPATIGSSGLRYLKV
jgi:hypothetical protein